MRRDRFIWALVGVAGASVILLCLYLLGPSGGLFPRCMFHHLTGLSCPGCGMTRGTFAALHGRFGEALRYNPLGMIVLPAGVVYMGVLVSAWVWDAPSPVRLKIGTRGALWIAGLLLGYWILRNIPAWPFTLLAPP